MVRKMCVYKINTVCRYEIQPTFIIFKCHFLFSSHMLLNKKKRREQEKPPKCNRDFPKGRYYLTALQFYPSVDNFSLSEWAKHFENRIYQERRRQKKIRDIYGCEEKRVKSTQLIFYCHSSSAQENYLNDSMCTYGRNYSFSAPSPV